MNNELKQDFTRRLSQCNKGEMIVIIYDIFQAYVDDAKEAFEGSDKEAYKTAIRKAQNTLDELIHSLNLEYDIAKNLQELYQYCKMILAKTTYENKIDKLLEAESIMSRLGKSFQEVAKQDDSPPLMQNTQQIVAGMTYGRNNLTENYINNDNRGFFV